MGFWPDDGLRGLGGSASTRLARFASCASSRSDFLEVLKLFESARLKIERADHHIADLERQFLALLEDNSYGLRIEFNPETGQNDIRIRFLRPVPAKPLALIIGDAIHNLRTALDHMTWEMVGRDGGKQHRQLRFPSHHDRASFEGACNGIETPSQAIRDALKATEAFPSGKGYVLYSLHALDNADKHTVLMPTFRVLRIPNHSILNPDGTTHSERGEHLWASSDTGSFFIPQRDPLPAGATIQIDQNAKPAIGIFFGGIDSVPMQPVLPLLGRLRHATANAIDIVERSIT